MQAYIVIVPLQKTVLQKGYELDVLDWAATAEFLGESCQVLQLKAISVGFRYWPQKRVSRHEALPVSERVSSDDVAA